MFCRSHLWKPFGLRRVGFVAAGAEYGRIEFVRFHGPWVIRVQGQRSVARFAIHMRMLAVFFLIEDVCMAGFTALVAGEFDGANSNFGYALPR